VRKRESEPAAGNELVLAHLVANRARATPDLDVLTFEGGGKEPDEVRTCAQLWDNARRIAGALAERGLRRGDHFGLLMQNHPEFVETMVAASILGAVFVPIDPRTRGEKLAYMLQHSRCRGIVCADYALATLAAVRPALNDLRWTLALDTGAGAHHAAVIAAGATSLNDCLRAPAPRLEIAIDDPTEPMQILYTSGTTGDPKGVLVRHVRFGTAATWHALFGYTPADRPYTGLSLTHGNAQMVTLASTLKLGMRAVFSRKFTKSRLWDITRRYGCTTFTLLGGMTTAIYSEPPRADDADNPVRWVVSAGMPAAIWEEFERRFGLRVLEFYGAIEGGLCMNPIGVGPIGSIGKPPPGFEMRIVDADDHECPPGERGEIVCRAANGPPPVVDYYRNPQASAAKTRGGWLRMGDIGHRDADGWFYFDYRIGGGIRHNGDFINPADVEKTIARSGEVLDVFVYGVPAASGAPGESDVVAAVVARDPATFDAQAVFRRCRQDLEPNAVPMYLQRVGEIPKTASEKPQERFLLEAFRADPASVHTEVCEN
jgi:crotonobetaine/carnitine-CoA ligase